MVHLGVDVGLRDARVTGIHLRSVSWAAVGVGAGERVWVGLSFVAAKSGVMAVDMAVLSVSCCSRAWLRARHRVGSARLLTRTARQSGHHGVLLRDRNAVHMMRHVMGCTVLCFGLEAFGPPASVAVLSLAKEPPG